MTNQRKQRIASILRSVDADTSPSTITLVNGLLSFIPDLYLQSFAEYVLTHYDKYKKPIVNITTASKEFKRILFISMIQRGEMQLKTVDETRNFLQEFFKGKEICNCVDGYYDTTIFRMDDHGFIINGYADIKLNSEETIWFYHWCFEHQKKIGIVQMDVTSPTLPSIKSLDIKQEHSSFTCKETNAMLEGLITKVRL